MRQGSAVHQTLENQVHQNVAVDITTKEDAWGLRLWNVIQGLKTLRETGMTRELEIWGTVDGSVVNGVIDELSFVCPDPALEHKDDDSQVAKVLPLNQTTITDFLGGSTLENGGQSPFHDFQALKTPSKIYLTDVKTRGSRTVPKLSSSTFRPTMMQLMLYHHLLSKLATNQVDANVLFERYALDPDATLSDSFIAQVGSLNGTFTDTSSSSQSDAMTGTQDSMEVLLAHNSIRSLWALMISEFERTMVGGAKSIGNVLKAEYRNATDGEIMGSTTFLYDDKRLRDYLEDEMLWWKGGRSAQGVCVEEAYKCGSCEFADECGWRKNKIVEATEKMRRSRSAV